MKNPKVSVVLAVYNHEKYVGQTMESVLGQTYQDWEFIIIDDCSTDGSVNVVRQYEDERIRFYPAEKNQGSVLTFNELLRKAKGEYVAIIGSDDVWYENKLQEQVDFMERHGEVGVCFSQAELMDENGILYSSREKCDCDVDIFRKENCTRAQSFRHFFENGNYFCHSSSLVRRRVIQEIGEFSPGFRQTHDYDYWVRVLQKYPVYLLPKSLVKYRRVRTGNESVSAGNQQNAIRVINESQDIVYKMIKEMDSEVFCEAFQDLLKKEIKNDTMLICEKYFVLLGWKIWGIDSRQPAIRFLGEQLNEEILECLEKEYQYSLNDYYEETGNPVNLYPIQFYGEYQKLEQIFYEQRRIIAKLKKEIREMSQSRSWKLTEPLRAAKRLVKRR